MNNKLSLVTPVFLALLTLFIFYKVTECDFIRNYDDSLYITENIQIKNGLTFETLTWALTASYASNWHPLTWLSHAFDIQFFGLNPFFHHLSSLLFHTANVTLVFLLFFRTTKNYWASFFAAVFFAIHPLRVESVAWVAERKDVLSTFLGLITIHLYISYTISKARVIYLLTIFIYCLALMAKPMVVTFPALLICLDYWPLDRFSKKKNVYETSLLKSITEKIPLIIPAAITSVVTYIVQRQSGAVSSFVSISIIERVKHMISSYSEYILKILYPDTLSVYYPYTSEISGSKFLFSGLFLLFFSIVVYKYSTSKKYLVTGWLWYLISLLPVIGLIQTGSQQMADRYTYLPSIGFFIIILWSAYDFIQNKPHYKLLMSSLFLVLIFLYSLKTMAQIPLWKNSITLFTNAINVTKNNMHAHNNLGAAYSGVGKLEEAIEQYNEVLKINSSDQPANHNLGLVYLKKGEYKKSIYHFQEALNSQPDFMESHFNIAIALLALRDEEHAIEHLQKVILLNPDFSEAYFRLGVAYVRKNEMEKAKQSYFKAISINPDFSEAHHNLGTLLDDSGDIKEAISHYNESIRIRPDFAEAHNSLGVSLARLGNLDLAKIHFETALKINPDYKDALENFRKITGSGR